MACLPEPLDVTISPLPYVTLSTIPWLRVTISPLPLCHLIYCPVIARSYGATSVVHIGLISEVAKTRNAWEDSSCEWRQVDIRWMYVPAESLEGVSTGHWKGEEGRRGSLLKLQKRLTLPLSLYPRLVAAGATHSQFRRSCTRFSSLFCFHVLLSNANRLNMVCLLKSVHHLFTS